MADTTNYEWSKPTVGGSVGSWGTELNTIFDDQDTDVKAVSDVADAALPVAGGTMTGSLRTNQIESDFVNIGSGGALTLDLNTGNTFYMNGGSAITLSLSNKLTTNWTAQFITLEILNGGLYGVTWPDEFQWQDGEAPTLVADGRDIIVVFCRFIATGSANNTFRAFAAHAITSINSEDPLA